MIYVSITGLRLNRAWHAPRFWLYAMPAMRQARQAERNLTAEARTIEGVHHTLTTWRDEGAMRAYLTTGAHLRAMRAFPDFASGRTIGFEAETAPDWAEARRIWQERGIPK